jgi:aconitate hydratase
LLLWTKSFACIHETNLKKKQGMLGLTFATESDYDLIQEDDTFNTLQIWTILLQIQLTFRNYKEFCSSDSITNWITYNASQIVR